MTRLLVSCRFAPYAETPRLAARHGLPVVEPDATWYESFAPGAWLANGRNAQIQDGHNSTPIGSVVVVTARDQWWSADGVIESDDPTVLERIRVGAAVSLGFDPIHSDDDLRVHVRRHDLAELRHIAILRRGEIGAYAGAKITSVVESRQTPIEASSPNDGWLAGLPNYWKDYVATTKPGQVAELIEGRRVAYRWNGAGWVATGKGIARAA
jgi:hypothetical protein